MMYLYAVSFESGVVKIGKSENPKQRVASVKCDRRAGKSKAVAVFISKGFDPALEAEACALSLAWTHGECAKLPNTREWFASMTFEDAKRYCLAGIRIAKKSKKYGIYYGHFNLSGHLRAFVRANPWMFTSSDVCGYIEKRAEERQKETA